MEQWHGYCGGGGGQDELHIKCICLVAGYAKQFGCNTHDRPAILEYEEIDEEIV